MLREVDEYDAVKVMCFKRLLNVCPQGFFCAGLLHDIILHKINEPNVMEHEFWFVIGKTKGDTTNMALVLLTNNILFDQDYRRWVMLWLLALVEDMEAWNAFPWGHCVWRLIADYILIGFEVPSIVEFEVEVSKKSKPFHYSVYGFAWAVQVAPPSVFHFPFHITFH
ncbi:Uncharacterized protein TCM_033724 [Theobroma cacao]|uniref:Phospholipase-like protein n=1 Tax=Theobroma cacao TaxID=3641 RepID=A0A061FC93_THECC|nr:Uncharacterized protein TCM_033724 [Theobroma cacao]